MVSFREVPGVAITFLVIAIILGIGATVLASVQGTQTAGTYAYNATEGGLEALDQLAGWQPTWAIVIAAVVIIGLISFFWMQRKGM